MLGVRGKGFSLYDLALRQGREVRWGLNSGEVQVKLSLIGNRTGKRSTLVRRGSSGPLDSLHSQIRMLPWGFRETKGVLVWEMGTPKLIGGDMVAGERK